MAMPPRRSATYEELKRVGVPPGSSWGIFGDLGTVARLGQPEVLSGVRTVRNGDTFRLDWPVNAFDPPPSATRRIATHHIFQKRFTHRDDYLDGFYLQSGTQIDGLRHQRHAEFGFYNGAPDESIVPGGGRLGVEGWATHGIVGRGVLVDVDRFLGATRGYGLDQEAGEPFAVGVVDHALEHQGTRLMPGDVLMLRTGWAEHYFGRMSEEARVKLPQKLASPGLLQEEAALAWLWDRGLSLVAADNVAVEALPVAGGPEYRAIDPDGRLHPPLISLLGIPLGELWKLDELATACAADRRFEMLVVAVPLNLPGGVGSPANAVAVR
jgi:kynurenine formamidase